MISGVLLAVVSVELLITNHREKLRANEKVNVKGFVPTAEQRFQKAQEVVDMLIDFSEEELAGNLEMEETRQRLLGIALGYYQISLTRAAATRWGRLIWEGCRNRSKVFCRDGRAARKMHRGILERPEVPRPSACRMLTRSC